MTKLEAKKRFFRFLKETGYYIEFKQNFNMARNRTWRDAVLIKKCIYGPKLYFNSISTRDYIVSAFEWKDIKWNTLHNKWIETLRSNSQKRKISYE